MLLEREKEIYIIRKLDNTVVLLIERRSIYPYRSFGGYLFFPPASSKNRSKGFLIFLTFALRLKINTIAIAKSKEELIWREKYL
jgi:hypothetical protein